MIIIIGLIFLFGFAICLLAIDAANDEEFQSERQEIKQRIFERKQRREAKRLKKRQAKYLKKHGYKKK